MHIISTKKNLDYIKIVGVNSIFCLSHLNFEVLNWKFLVRKQLAILSYKLQIRIISMSLFESLQATGQVDIRLSQNVEIFRHLHSNRDFYCLKSHIIGFNFRG
jgi:hypothetical protein